LPSGKNKCDTKISKSFFSNLINEKRNIKVGIKASNIWYFSLINSLIKKLELESSQYSLYEIMKDWEIHEYLTYKELDRNNAIFRHSIEHPFINNSMFSTDFVVFTRTGKVKLILECKFVSLPLRKNSVSIERYIDRVISNFDRPSTYYVLNDDFYLLSQCFDKVDSKFIRISDIQGLLNSK